MNKYDIDIVLHDNLNGSKEAEREGKVKAINSEIIRRNKLFLKETEKLHNEGMNRLKAFRL
jgi:hypothetical protein